MLEFQFLSRNLSNFLPDKIVRNPGGAYYCWKMFKHYWISGAGGIELSENNPSCMADEIMRPWLTFMVHFQNRLLWGWPNDQPINISVWHNLINKARESMWRIPLECFHPITSVKGQGLVMTTSRKITRYPSGRYFYGPFHARTPAVVTCTVLGWHEDDTRAYRSDGHWPLHKPCLMRRD